MKREFPSIKRRPPRRQPKKAFTLFCEGKNTEPVYFRMLRRTFSEALLVIEIIEAAGAPITIAKKARDHVRKRRRVKDSFIRSDETWAVFDRDEHERWEEAIQICQDFGVSIACSNPCFELWLILHYKEHDRPDTRHEIQSVARKIVKGYDPESGKKPDCDSLSELITVAEIRAERQLENRKREGADFCGHPSTTVGKLTRAIRSWRT